MGQSKLWTRRAAVAAAAHAMAAGAWAQAGGARPQAAAGAAAPGAWPSQPIKIVIGFPQGSSPDLAARALAEPLSKKLGQPVVVENKSGASGNVAAAAVAHATDAHTVGLMINGNLTVAKMLNPALSFDPAKDFAPLALVGTAPLVLVAPSSAPGSTAAETLAAAAKSGASWSYGSPGAGTTGHIGMELLKAKTGIKAVHAPYTGNPQVIQGLVGQQIQLALLPPGLAAQQVQTKRLRALGVTSKERSPLAPGVPTLAEAGVKSFELEVWLAAVAPASMPKPAADKLASAFAEVIKSPETKQKLMAQGWQAAGGGPDALAARMRADTAVLGAVVKERGIKSE